MKLTYAIELQDYKAALRLHETDTPLRRIGYCFWYRAVPILAVLGLGIFIFGRLWETLDSNSPYIWLLSGLLWSSIFFPLMRFINTRRCFKLILPAAAKNREVSLELTEDSIVSEIPEVSSGKFFWNSIVKFSQDDRVTLLYIAKTRFLFFPTRALTPDRSAELKALIAMKLGGK